MHYTSNASACHAPNCVCNAGVLFFRSYEKALQDHGGRLLVDHLTLIMYKCRYPITGASLLGLAALALNHCQHCTVRDVG